MTFTSRYRTRFGHSPSSSQYTPEFWNVLGEAEGRSPGKGISYRGNVYPHGQTKRSQRCESCEDHPDNRSPPFQQNSSLRPSKVTDHPVPILPPSWRSGVIGQKIQVVRPATLDSSNRPSGPLSPDNDLNPIQQSGKVPGGARGGSTEVLPPRPLHNAPNKRKTIYGTTPPIGGSGGGREVRSTRGHRPERDSASQPHDQVVGRG